MDALLKRLQWRHLRLITAIGETGQLSFAADRVGLTQPAASRMMAEIESALGHRLFARVPKGMVPTPIGEVMLRRATVLMQGLSDTVDEIGLFAEGRRGSVRVGSVTGAALTYVVPAAQALNAERGGADIHIDVAPSEVLARGLLKGDYDFVLSRLPPKDDIRRLRILGGRVEVVEFLCRAGHPLARLDTPTVAALAGYGWVIQSVGSPLRTAVESAYASHGVAIPAEILNTTSLLVTIAYLRDTDAIAPVSSEVATALRNADAARLTTIRLAQSIIIYPYHLYQLEDRLMSPIGERMLEMISTRMMQG